MTSRSRHGQMIILCARRQTVLRKNAEGFAQKHERHCAKRRTVLRKDEKKETGQEKTPRRMDFAMHGHKP